MASFAAAAIGATGVGPLIAGWIEQNPHLEWRWIQWIHAMYGSTFFLSFRANAEAPPLQHCWRLCDLRAGIHEGDTRVGFAGPYREEDAQGNREPPVPRTRGGRERESENAHLHLVHAASV